MRRAEGPFTTGTFLVITRLNDQDQLAKVRSNGTGHELLGTKNRNDENIEVCTVSTASTRISHPYFLVVF